MPCWRNVSFVGVGATTVAVVSHTRDVRQRRHEQTQDALVEAAIELFDAHGYAAVTVEQIAAAAGVSRRTAYRRFRTKDDILLEVPRRWVRVFDDAVASHPDLHCPELIETAALAVSAHVDEHRRKTLVGLRALADAPGLNAASVAHDDWHRRVSALLVADGLDPVDAQLVAGAYLGGIDAMLAIWMTGDATSTLVALNLRLNERLRPIWQI